MLDPRTLGKLVLQHDWTLDGAVALIEQPTDVAQAIAEYEGIRSLIQVEPDMDPSVEASQCAELRKWLKPIGMANWPEANWDRGEWLSATMLALSDLPPKVAISAAKQAIHRDFRFPNEVKPAIREIAAEILARHSLALRRLKMMRDGLKRPVPQIEQQPMVWNEREVEKCNASFAKLGLATRYRLKGDEVEAYEKNGGLY